MFAFIDVCAVRWVGDTCVFIYIIMQMPVNIISQSICSCVLVIHMLEDIECPLLIYFLFFATEFHIEFGDRLISTLLQIFSISVYLLHRAEVSGTFIGSGNLF